MFVTFYSYKGGVGRSLALANMACLMAEDKDHPQRVLLWDFDLEAPGLHKLFPPRTPQRYGFVDMAYEYATKREAPNAHDFIYESEVDGLYVLPAGNVDKFYCEKLQKINWLNFFDDDPKTAGPFFGELINSIKGVKEPFDYVLVDSRTGLNDLAGICTQVIPDLLVVLFRLTSQNFDGLQHLIPSIRSQLDVREKKSVKFLPIASQVGSAASRGISELRPKAEKLFGGNIEYIRFDEELVSRERLFSKKSELDALWPLPPIVDDYKRVCSTIRDINKEDTKTLAGELRVKIMEGDRAAASAMLLRLLARRPRLSQAWVALEGLFEVITNERKKEFQQTIRKILKEDKANFFAHKWQSWFHISEASDFRSPKLRTAKKSLTKAMQSAPIEERGTILQKLARIESCAGNHEKTIEALKEALLIQPANSQLNLDLAMMHTRMGEKYFALACEELDRVSDEIGSEKYMLLAYLRTFIGEGEKAKKALSECSEEVRTLAQAHVLLIKGKKDEALVLIDKQIESARNLNELPNWIEAYICSGEFNKAIRKINRLKKEKGEFENINALAELAEYLNKKTEPSEKDYENLLLIWDRDCSHWNMRELLMARETLKRKHADCVDRFNIIEKFIQLEEFRKMTSSAGFRGRRGAYGFKLNLKKSPHEIVNT